MMQTYFDSGYEIRSVLRTLFHSDYFQSEQARFTRVKGPVELVIGAVRLAGSYRKPTFGADQLARYTMYMGQGLFQPPSVEGWHKGMEWIDSGTLLERLNFIGSEVGHVKNPEARAIIDRLAAEGEGVFSAPKAPAGSHGGAEGLGKLSQAGGGGWGGPRARACALLQPVAALGRRHASSSREI